MKNKQYIAFLQSCRSRACERNCFDQVFGAREDRDRSGKQIVLFQGKAITLKDVGRQGVGLGNSAWIRQ
jgi:hypothetical protein